MDKLFLVTNGVSNHVVTWAKDREDAKRKAQIWLGRDPEQYTVTPLTRDGDRVHLAITLNA